ncbi:MAG: ATP-binding cassette domain-containing protein [Myxococcota bacterium]
MKLGFIEIFDSSTRAAAVPSLVLAAFGGLLSSALVPLASLGMRRSLTGIDLWVVVALYALVLWGCFRLRTRAATRASVALERRLQSIERELLARLRRASLRAVESHPQLEEAFSRDVETLRYIPRITSDFVHDVVLLVGLTAYLASLSVTATVAWGVLIALMISLLRIAVAESLDAATEFDGLFAELGAGMRQALDGLPQLKLDHRVADGVCGELDATITRLRAERRRRDRVQAGMETNAVVILLGVKALVLFMLPSLGLTDVSVLSSVIAIVIFIEGPLFDLVHKSQYLVGAEGAWRNLRAWEARLPPESGGADEARPDTFQRIDFEGVRFRYHDGDSFEIGPIDLSLRPGEIVFIVGDNGSGKTTLMKLLCGLYEPREGALMLDGVPLEGAQRIRYRRLFSVVFAQHQLFERAYGLDVGDPSQVQELLERFALAGVTGLRGDRFTSRALSSGQAKRLAMVVALLEERPILVLDEWAAHQEPQLRRDFYERLLPELRARGKTIVAISHDDRFFACADRIVRLRDGRLVEGEEPA